MIRSDNTEPSRTPPDLFEQPAPVPLRSVRAEHLARTRNEIPFVQRPTCTIREACQAAGLGRTKLYELIRCGTLETSTIGRRRLILVPSLLKTIKFKE